MDKRKNIKIVFLSDTHLGHDYPIRNANNARKGEDFFKNFFKVIEKTKNIKADLLIHGGDLFDKADVNQKVIDRCYDAFYELADLGIPVIIIPGNHDNNGLPSSLFVEHPNLYLLNKTSNTNLTLNGKEFEIHSIPFTKKIGDNFENELNKLHYKNNPDSFKILLVHQSLEGCKVGPVDFTFKNNENSIGLNQIPNYYDIILSGHIHRHQIIEIQNSDNSITPFIYSGSTEKTSFSEIKEEKGFIVLEFKKKNSLLQPDIRFEKLTTRPMYDILLQDNYIDEKSIIDKITHNAKKLESNAVIRIVSDNNNTKKMLTSKLLNKCFGDDNIVSVKGISSLYKTTIRHY